MQPEQPTDQNTAPVGPAPVYVQPQQPQPQPQPRPVVQPQPVQQVQQLEQPAPAPEPVGEQPIQWQAPEYVQERRSPWWFIGFWVVVIILMLAAIFIIRSISFAVLVPAMAAALMIYSHRPPRTLSYVLSSKGLYINEKLHPLAEFRSFGVVQDESIPSLMLLPVQRFRPGLSVHFPSEAGETIVDMLGSRIPMQEIKLDAFDKIIQKLHI